MTTQDGVKHWDRLRTVGSAPCYRDVSLNIELHSGTQVEINLRPDDALRLYRELRDVICIAWRRGTPLDAQEHEQPPEELREAIVRISGGAEHSRRRGVH